MSDVTMLNTKVTSASIMAEARKEVVEGRAKEAKSKIKAKLSSIEAAKQVVANLERELEVLLAQVDAELKV